LRYFIFRDINEDLQDLNGIYFIKKQFFSIENEKVSKEGGRFVYFL